MGSEPLSKPTPASPAAEKDRYLRALYRQHRPDARWTRNNKLIIDQAQQARQWRIVSAEYERLYGRPSANAGLALILKSAWIEDRELAGQRYDFVQQTWIGPDGQRVD